MDVKNLQDYASGRIHFIGIGGCSMSGLALILKNIGYNVTGSDLSESVFTDRLAAEGIDVSIGHKQNNVDGAALCVYSAAIKPENPERKRAAELDIPMLERASLLGLLSEEYENVIAIAGCHGKTTITSMIALITEYAGVDATVHVGGMVDFLGSGVRLGQTKKYFITEACEYVESFLKLSPSHILINNIDDDHLDYYKDIEQIYQTFEKFVQLMPQDGHLYLCKDNALAYRLKDMPYDTTEYGLTDNSGYMVANVEFSEMGFPSFDIKYQGKNLGRIALEVPGSHNMANALAAFAICHSVFGVSIRTAAKALKAYRLVGRRFEYMGEKNGVKIIHDYAHHPSEITACLDAAKRYPHKKLWAVFQCNSYTRAKTLKDKYALSFGEADFVLVPDIYPGRDIDTGEIHATDLVEAIKPNAKACEYIATFE
ncbi:MAG: UDP-N-acetylmuramate--L-alanine ligase, partial [Eubacteriales bacterium]